MLVLHISNLHKIRYTDLLVKIRMMISISATFSKKKNMVEQLKMAERLETSTTDLSMSKVKR